MEILQALHESGFAWWLRRATTLYPFFNAFHILSIGLVVGAIGTLDLRVLGLFRESSLSHLGPPLSRMAALGVTLAFASGFVIFSVQPVAYAQNPAFLLKVGLAVLGAVNALALHGRPAWRAAMATGEAGLSVKAQAGASLAIWAAAVISGRWIAFVE